MEKIRAEAVLAVAIVAEVMFGFLTGLLVLGLVPGDDLDFNVLGSVVLALLCGTVYWTAHRYVVAHVPDRT